MIRIVVDTSSDISFKEAEEMGVTLVALPVTFGEELYDHKNDENFKEFYNKLVQSKELPKTSQPSPSQYLDIYNDAKDKNDDVLVITLSSGLSGTYDSAKMAKTMSDYDKITIVDSRQATVALRMLIDYAIRLRDEGKTVSEIEALLENVRDRIVVCGLLDTLTYLKKGGRIPPAMALIGNVLNIKPVIILKDKKLEQLGKARGFEKGKNILYDEYEKEEIDTDWTVNFGYVSNISAGEKFMAEATEKYGLINSKLYPVGSVIGTHVGPGCVVIAFVRKK